MRQHTPSLSRRRRRWWLIPVAAGAAVLLVTVGVTVAHFAAPDTTATSAGTAAATPAGTATAAPVKGVDYASGCVAGPGITTKDLLALRERKQFTPAGAAEFVGAFMQLYGAADPERRPNLREAVDAVTDSTAHTMLATSDLSKSVYDDTDIHSVDLSGSAYHVKDSTDTTVTIAFAGLTTTNGKPTPAAGSTTQYQYLGGTFTLASSAQGWVITGYDSSPGWNEPLSSGNIYRTGC